MKVLVFIYIEVQPKMIIDGVCIKIIPHLTFNYSIYSEYDSLSNHQFTNIVTHSKKTLAPSSLLDCFKF